MRLKATKQLKNFPVLEAFSFLLENGSELGSQYAMKHLSILKLVLWRINNESKYNADQVS
jgi:hypothetical protein